MAEEKSDVNKSEAIREAYKELPKAKAKEIVTHLEKKGIDVTVGLVYQVKKISKKKGSKKFGKSPQIKTAQVAAPSKNGVLSIGASIAVVKATADKVGGWTALKEIVDALQ